MRIYKGKCDIFVAIGQRLRKEEMEEQFNREAKEGWRFAADARNSDETAGSEDRKHTSGGVFTAVASDFGAVVGEKEGEIASIPGNEGRITQAWVNARGGMRVFSVYSEGWTPRNETLLEVVLKRARITRHPWLVADANMGRLILKKASGFRGTGCMWWLRGKLLRAGQKVQKENGSLSVTAYKGKEFADGGGRRP